MNYINIYFYNIVDVVHILHNSLISSKQFNGFSIFIIFIINIIHWKKSKRNLYPLAFNLHSPNHLSPNLLFISTLPFINISYTWSTLASFTLYVFKVHLCCLYWTSILFYWQTLFHCMDVSCLCIDSLADLYLNSFNLLHIMRNTALNIWVQIFVWTYTSISCDCRYRIVSYVTLCPIIWGIISLFSKAAASLYIYF